MFFKGALLKDSEGVLEEQGPNSRSARRIRFTSVEEVVRLNDTVKAYIGEAIDVEEAGLEMGPPPEPLLGLRAHQPPEPGPETEGCFRGADPWAPAGIQPVLFRCKASQDPRGTSREIRS